MNIEKLKEILNTYFIDVLKTQYTDFKGRATRRQFWMYQLVLFVAILLISIVAGVIRFPLLSGIAMLGIIVPTIAISVRRIRDLGVSGWCILVSFIPVIGGLTVFVGYCLPTDYLKPYAEQVKQKYLNKK